MTDTGRPNKFNKEVKEKLFYAIRKGAPYSIACNYARVSEALFYRWKAEAKQGNNPEMVEFLEQLKEAEAETALKWLDVIENAMVKEWQPAAWKLERRHYVEFSSNPVVREEFKELKSDIDNLKKKHGESHGKEAKEVDPKDAHEEGCFT